MGDIMNFSYKKTAAAVVVFTLLLSSLLIIIAYRSGDREVSDYILKDYNGAVALYNNEKIVTVYDGIVLSALPYADRARFTEGVRVESIEEADSIIEDYDG